MELAQIMALRDVADVRYAELRTAFRNLVQEEIRLRGLLADLDQQEVKCRQSLAQDPTLRILGGDISWHKWIGKNREILNVSLANTLARKETAMAEFRKASGKSMVMEELCDDLAFKARKVRRKKLQDALDNHAFLQQWRG